MIAFGYVLMFLGWILIFAGVKVNHNGWAQLASFVYSGSGNPGNVLIVIGVILLIGSFFMLCAGYKQRNDRKSREAMMFMQMDDQPRHNSQPSAPAHGASVEFRIQGVTGAFAGKRFRLEGVTRLGREAGRCTLVFPSSCTGVSRVHCELWIEGDSVILKDLGSTHGTFVEGSGKIQPNIPVRLRIGSRFWLGSEKELFVIAPKGGI